jgi:hypothetical protein
VYKREEKEKMMDIDALRGMSAKEQKEVFENVFRGEESRRKMVERAKKVLLTFYEGKKDVCGECNKGVMELISSGSKEEFKELCPFVGEIAHYLYDCDAVFDIYDDDPVVNEEIQEWFADLEDFLQERGFPEEREERETLQNFFEGEVEILEKKVWRDAARSLELNGDIECKALIDYLEGLEI